jgi:drug/metabolite transporter (DMT)-like permease
METTASLRAPRVRSVHALLKQMAEVGQLLGEGCCLAAALVAAAAAIRRRRLWARIQGHSSTIDDSQEAR